MNKFHAWLILSAMIIIPMLGYGGYCLNRWINWHFGYESMVKQTITDMVKPECLK